MRNYGFLKPTIRQEDYVLGAGKAPLILLQKDGQWDESIDKLREIQHNSSLDSHNCIAHGLENQLVPYMRKRHGVDVNYSERGIGINAGTWPPGNDPGTVYQSAREKGFLKQESLPFNESITSVDEYYSPRPLTIELQIEGEKWNEEYTFYHEWVWNGNPPLEEKIHNMKVALKYSPLAIDVYAWAQDENGVYIKVSESNHWVCCYGYTDKGWKVYDSYENSHKIYSFDSNIDFCKRISVEKKEVQKIEIKIPWYIRFWQWLVNERMLIRKLRRDLNN
jgi:hypothetical protein